MFLKSQNIKAFKLIRTNKGERLLLGYFKKYDDYVKTPHGSFTLNNEEHHWSKTVPPPPSSNKKKRGSSLSRQPQKPLTQMESFCKKCQEIINLRRVLPPDAITAKQNC
ncbi:hypothetical protein RclHR1_34370001 [Rhizophagus clarus]|uniref:Uncharacterized protein n=1 Tax=Rhizophagus clarus TaxID=94130 RepID=A0A2Z6RA06_9GLOM|nr:hypothetical protein RclHR1_34370001 [Rhizophagus clarus]GES82309.1 hypothetical protein RCL_jg4921.t1 [Rhizophagus clarus]